MDVRRVIAVMAGACGIMLLVACCWCPCCRRAEVVAPTATVAPAAVAVAPTPVQVEPITIDSSDATGRVEKVGDWPPGVGGEDLGDGCLFAFKGKGECKFLWRPDLPKTGKYRVSVWFGGDPNSDHATDSPFTVYYDGGTEPHKIDQTKTSGGWKVLGTYTFQAGKSGYVELTNDANGNVVADGVKFELVE